MLYQEANPYIASLDYDGDISMMGKTLVGLMFPRDWNYIDIMDWFWDSRGLDSARLRGRPGSPLGDHGCLLPELGHGLQAAYRPGIRHCYVHA